jgi:putative MATE family efflux protein
MIKKVVSFFSHERDFYKTLIKLGIPVALQNFFSAFFGLIDNIMVGQLGDVSVASVGLANQFYFVLVLIMIPIGGAVSIFASQFWGKKNTKPIPQVMILGLGLSVVASLVFFISAFFAPEFVMRLFSRDAKVIESGSVFIKIISISYIPLAVNYCIASTLRSIHAVKMPLFANAVGILLNTTLNYLLIYGNFGFPKLGINGAAISTVIAQTLALIIILTSAVVKYPDIFRWTSQVWKISTDLVRRFFAQAGILIAKDLIWALGITTYMIIYARMSTDAAAAMNITSVVRELAIVIFIGIGCASQIVIGNAIGADKKEEAHQYAVKFLLNTFIIGFIVGIILILSRYLILSPYKVSSEVVHGASGVMIVFGASLAVNVYNMVAVMGVMRPGGDNFFCTVMDIVAVWMIGFPLALLSGLVWKMPLIWVFTFVTLQELFKMVLLTRRLKSRLWIRNLVDDIE